jgi:hypothetical protein
MSLQTEEARANQPAELVLDKDLLNDRLKPASSDQPRIPLPTQGSKANTLEGAGRDTHCIYYILCVR